MNIEELLESVDKEWKKENGYVLSLCEPHYFATLVAQKVFEATKNACKDEFKYLDIDNVKFEDLNLD